MIPNYKNERCERIAIRKKVKEGEIRLDDLSQEQRKLFQRRKKGEKLYGDLNNKIYINVRASIVESFFQTTIDSIKEVDKKIPISNASLNFLCRRVFIFLYLQGIRTYKDASSRVITVFIALVTLYETQLYEEDYGGGFRYKEFFLKQMQNIRNSLVAAGIVDRDHFQDVPANLDEDLAAT